MGFEFGGIVEIYFFYVYFKYYYDIGFGFGKYDVEVNNKKFE